VCGGEECGSSDHVLNRVNDSPRECEVDWDFSSADAADEVGVRGCEVGRPIVGLEGDNADGERATESDADRIRGDRGVGVMSVITGSGDIDMLTATPD